MLRRVCFCRHLSPETPRRAAEFATALAAQIAAAKVVAGLFDEVQEEAADVESELLQPPLVSWQMLKGCFASRGS